MNKIFRKSVFIIFGVLNITFTSQLFAQTASPINMQLYILAGQSNMAGRGPITEEYASINHPNVYMLDKNNQWVQAKHPLHFDKPSVAGVGPGLAFAIKMAEANPNIQIGLIPCAVGGTSITSWKQSGFDKATNTHPYDDAVARIKIAMLSGTIKGILWHQGESDSNPQAISTYLNKLSTLIISLRQEIGNEKIPVVIGELGPYKENYRSFNTELQKVTGFIHYCAVASSASLTDKGDVTHFNSKSASIMGERMAEQMLLIQKQYKNN